MRTKTLALAAATLTVAALAAQHGAPLSAADHGDSPIVRLNAQLDINDVYAFAAPEDSTHTVLIMTVSPLAGITGPTTFATKANYEFNIDLNGDGVADSVHTLTFSNAAADGTQSVTVAQKGPSGRSKSKGTTGVAFQTTGGARVQAGLFDDPFFFDLIAFRRGFQFSSTAPVNFFKGLNTLAIVMDVPNTTFGSATTAGVWCTTTKGKKQIDRNGRPAINTVLIPTARKDEFNAAKPKDDRTKFKADVVAKITALRSGNATGVDGLADVLLPDILTFAPGNTSGFLNGRKLADDVIDAELDLLTSGGVTTDFVGNDSTFLGVFPYLAPKNP